MSLAIDNIRLLTLTARKADCEFNISVDSMRKMQLTREQAALSQEYYAKLQGKNISYYANGQYNKMTYAYLMGNYATPTDLIDNSNSEIMKKDNSMVLTDYNGRVVMNSFYANIMQKVLGTGCVDANGVGGTFSLDNIPALISEAAGTYCSEEDVKAVLNNGSLEYGANFLTQNTMTGEQTSEDSFNKDLSTQVTSAVSRIVNYYYPIFQAAAANGWTTEYNKEMESDSNYLSDALVSGIFQLEQIDSTGTYKPDASLSYFVTSGLVLEKTDSSAREEITAWYNSEKEKINEQESWLDINISDLSTELEAINTEIKTLEDLINNDIEVFDWGGG